MSRNLKSGNTVKRSFWIAAAAYLLIGFEFFYMISPFAVYFYSVYEPGLSFLNGNPVLGFLGTVFLPHFVAETSSWFLNQLFIIGSVLFFAGLAFFVIGATQVYHAKLTRKAAVTGGIYNYIRHPQYAALAVSGLGLLLLWPRYMVLLSYVTMLFFYFFLARIEERECETRFGRSYTEYKNRTGMFFPFGIGLKKKLIPIPEKGLSRFLVMLLIFLGSCLITIKIGDWSRDWSLNSIYASYENDMATVSITRLEESKIKEILNLAVKDPDVKSRLRSAGTPTMKMINYIAPVDWIASEVPMNPVPNAGDHLGYRPDSNIKEFRIVFTRAVLRAEKPKISGKAIIINTRQRIPLLEVIINVSRKEIVKILEPVKDYRLDGVPLPLF